MNALQLVEMAQGLFDKRSTLLTLWQEIAMNFFVERATFTIIRDPGDDIAAGLMSSYPLLVRRDLQDQIGSMLRPEGQPWFKTVPTDPERETDETRGWLEFATTVQRRAMYDKAAMLKRATKEGDADYATFGQCIISCEMILDNQREGPHLLHRCWHLRDVAWQEDCYGNIGNRFRKWRPTARELAKKFPGRVHKNVNDQATGTGQRPNTEIDCMHLIVEADLYDMTNKGQKPWVSIYYDCLNKHLIEAVATWNPIYAIPRWQTVSGSPYAHSPASIVALPEARMIQAMSSTLLEAGEKIANPPMVATDDVVRSDVQIFPGGITWVDRDYDERLGQALRPMTTDAKGMPLTVEMLDRAGQIVSQCFYLNKLRPIMPTNRPDMTAYEVGQIVQQYIREALPLFGPMEPEYNGQICELDFDLLRRYGAFGSPYDMPRALQGAKVGFQFMSPLHDAIEAQKTHKFLEMSQLLATAVQMDKNVAAVPNAVVAFRDALSGAGIPAKWTRTKDEVDQIMAQEQAKQQAQELIQGLLPASQAAANLGSAAKDAQTAGVL